MTIVSRLVGLVVASALVWGAFYLWDTHFVRTSLRELRRADWFKAVVQDYDLKSFETVVFGGANDLILVLNIVLAFILLLLFEKIGGWISSVTGQNH